MYNVYVVDDDALILEEIVKSVPWIDNGFEVVGYSSNPITAIEQIVQLHPHLVITDLKMPGLNGIDMISAIKEKDIECEFVMLSSFGTFEDSRAFFLLEGFDYILKPLQQADMQLVLERIAAKIAKKVSPFHESDLVGVNASFAQMINFIRDNFNQKLTLGDLAKRFNLSPNYTCNLFSKHYNSTLTRFVTELRMQQAVKLMTDTSKAYKEIAVNCGYLDYFYFCKVFKEYYGLSPSQYRTEKL